MGEAECTSENIFICQRQCVGEKQPINMYFILLSSVLLFSFFFVSSFSKVMEQVWHQNYRKVFYSTQEKEIQYNLHNI